MTQSVPLPAVEQRPRDSSRSRAKTEALNLTAAHVNGCQKGPSSSTSTAVDDNAICIVGMGGISSPSGLWNFLHEIKSAKCPVPADRFNIDGFYHADGSRAGVMDVRGGYFLREDVRRFDNSFFGINNLEASYMDPQQRKLLEVVFECFENAGLSMEDVSGSNTAVYVGNFTVDYQSMQSRDPDYLHRYSATGGGTSIMSNRISHVFNLQGPSLTLDTACSSSIYALHHAVTAIKNGDCDGAIVAGANLITSPEQHLGTAQGGFLSPTSDCKPFDSSADGYARAEGVNAIYIKRLASAVDNDERIHAVIRGTAINANGKTPGITLPDAKMQEAVVRKAYRNAGLDFADTDYIECHGTGTAVGDPIEVDGLASCFAGRDGEAVMLGSVKSNLGHSEAASGLTSVIKVALAFEHGMIPPTYGIKNLNPKLKLETRNMRVLTQVEAWPRTLRRASINSFGYGGANGHVILESVESYLHSPPSINGHLTNGHGHQADQLLLLPFSAASGKSLETRRQQVVDVVQQVKDSEHLQHLATSLSKRHAKLRLRDFALATASPKPALLEGNNESSAVEGASPLPFAFIFTGQGAQYAGMARELLEQNESFLASIRELDQVLRSLPSHQAPSWTLEQTILDPAATSKVNDVTRSQPLCTAVQIALVDLLRSWGVSPSAVIGHSSGEIAASYSAGLLTAPQAILAAYFRGFAVGQMKVRGAMMAAGLTAAAATSLIDDLGLTEVRVACVNAPESVTLSGSEADIETLQAELQKQNKFARKLETGGRAYHSHMMVQVGDLYEQLVAPYFGISSKSKSHSKTVSMFSTVGQSAEDLGVVDRLTNMAVYFRRNLEQPVQFNSALHKLMVSGKYHFVEIGPHSALKGPVQQIRSVAKRDKLSAPYSATLVRKEDANIRLKKLAGALFVHGHDLDWRVVNGIPKSRSRVVDLPPYPWDYSKELPWHEPRASVDIRNRKHIRHELLGTRTAAGNGIDWSWRNIMRLSEMPWLRDHKLGPQVVLPGSAYIAIAIEALTQIRDLKGKLAAGEAMSFECESINISAPFLVPDDGDAEAEHTELHTTMCQRKISTANASGDWYEFSVSSWASGHTTLHCTGSIRKAQPSIEAGEGSVHISSQGYEAWSMGRWYDKSREEGLNFGPHFESLTSLHTDGNRTCADAIATTLLEPPSAGSAGMPYAIHPITIDACFQAAIMGGTAGNLSSLRAYVPVFIEQCCIQVPRGGCVSLGTEECRIHSRMERTGFSTRKVNCTLRQPNGLPVIDMKNVRMSLYTGKSPVQSENSMYLQRQPCLRILWKPDILRMHSGSETELREYLGAFAAGQSVDMKDNESLLVLAALLDLAGHKMPRMRVLELGQDCQCIAQQCLGLLGNNTAFPRCRSWTGGRINEGELILEESAGSEPFDVVVIPHHSTSQKVWLQAPEQLVSFVSEQGIVMTRRTDQAVASLKAAGFVTLELPRETLLAVRSHKTTGLENKEVVVITPNKSSPAIDALADALESHLKQSSGVTSSSRVSLNNLEQVKLSSQVVCVSLLETEREFLATMSETDMNRLRNVTDNVAAIIWLTGANMLAAPVPDLTLSSGLSRALMLEQPALRFTVLDIGAADMTKPGLICNSVLRALTPCCAMDDTEFVQVGDVLYVSRFAPALDLNSLFRQRLEQNEPVTTATLAEIAPARLSIGQVGMTDTMHFQQVAEPPSKPAAGFIDVDLRAISLNAKDVYAINGRVETRAATTALDFGGVVSAVGPGIDHLKPGDRVVGLAPNHFGTTERVPAASVHKLLPEEDYTVLATLLTVYSTALFALRDRGHLRAGESILIHGGAGAFGLAAIAMAQSMGATVYTTVGSQSKRDYLVDQLGVPPGNIFNSRDASFVEAIKAATGRGVDVIVNSLVGDLMHASWSCIAPFGRFVEIGKRELIDAGKLDMHVFLKNTTFTAFDLSEFFYAEDAYYRNIFYGLIAEVMTLYRQGKIKAPPVATFDVSEIAQAYRYFTNKDRIGKVAISMENPHSRVPVMPAQYKAVFDADKTYLLVGCLGGLGRSLSRWMMSRGARKFVFLGRSGCDKPTARQLVSRLQDSGASVTVVRGDVSDAGHMREAVAACVASGPIGGVVQAAMGLKEALFTTMTNDAWHIGIQPKWKGTWNLHNALGGHDDSLDFFLMTSSLSGSCGTATESNYCAANGFLDAFARWRRSQGKPAVSLGLGMISEVGYLHENPEIEALLLRKGIQPLNEDEFLQVVDFGLAGPGGETDFVRGAPGSEEGAHILTGLEPYGIRKLMDRGFDVNNGIMEDSRTSLLAASLLAERDAQGAGQGADVGQLNEASDWVKDVPASAISIIASEASAPTLRDAVLRLTKRRFGNLILMPADQVEEGKPLASFGVDSMLAAEFRTWFWNTFKLDVPFLDIVSPQKTLRNLAEFVEEKLVESWAT
ncbi:hypothetical protein CDD80_839 [Ophiocordyceps camponoti-rufipedis]|uniref:Uncharacterized protein n=1 Tax=Ophiocordyceps camponoti-rufipedis TaxID=2004952 RepID=A0A2C5ZLA6_9HYPO|nr:hypothetical protein CDD80_839 [Ophiocordyceps camponoti-rufipedis]